MVSVIASNLPEKSRPAESRLAVVDAPAALQFLGELPVEIVLEIAVRLRDPHECPIHVTLVIL